jgi:16S rRNA (uracil1498-N3)-methyltransferase
MMMMLRVPLHDLVEGERELDAAAARYVTRVHRLRRGDSFVAFDPDKRLEAESEILESGRRVRVRLGPPRASTAVATRKITLLQASVTANKLDQVVRDATELGATEVVVIATDRATQRRNKRWERIAVEAARQAGRGDAPAISGPVPLSKALARTGVRLCLHPSAEESFAAALRGVDPDAPVSIAIGPEGGFSDDEIALMREAGYRVVRLGRFVMRTETVCAAVLGALAALQD